ncbi:MAG: pentapeptide repeat-containing protein [Actinomycetota bacterium]|nr:pentapeptide repeat-containing protein [Actinomycetota bacterium]
MPHLAERCQLRVAGWAGVAALACSLSGSGSASGQAGTNPPAPETRISSQELGRRAARGEPIDLVGATVEGDVDLRSFGTLTRPFRCQRCRFTGSLKAADLVFERIVEVSNSTVEGPLELRGAVFRDRANFEATRFLMTADLTAARFLGDVSFGGASFVGNATFRSAKFEAKADFVQLQFAAASDFDGVFFTDGVSFLLAEFNDGPSFRGSEFRAGGSFRLLRLRAGAAFDRMTSGGVLEFDGAVFEGDVSLTNLSSSGSISLEGVIFQGSSLFMDQLSVRDLSMDVRAVNAVRGRNPQKAILKLIERSAQERGDLSLANDARYELLSIESRERDDVVGRLLDVLFYRAMGGYLVRPLHPLITLLMLLAGATLLRSVPALLLRARRGPERAQASAARPVSRIDWSRQAVLDVEKTVTVVLNALATSIAVAFRPKPAIKLEDPDHAPAYFLAACRWGEFLAYKLLLTVFLLALGNSSSTIRQIMDTVRS